MSIEKEKELYNFQRKINIVIQKVINFSIIQSELKNSSYPINNERINCEKFFDETYKNPEKSNKMQTVTDDSKKSLISNKSSKNNHKIKFINFYPKKNINKCLYPKSCI